MTEAQEQIAVIEYCDLQGIPCFHIPNGGARNPREGAHLKRQGVRRGVPDLCVPVPKGIYHSLYIEMKTLKGRPTKEQKEWISTLREFGHCAYICKGVDAAIKLIDMYFNLEEGKKIDDL